MFWGHFHRIASLESWTYRKLIFVVAKTELSTRLNSSLFHMRNHCRNHCSSANDRFVDIRHIDLNWIIFRPTTEIEQMHSRHNHFESNKIIHHFSWKYSHRPLRPHSLLIVSNSCSKWIKSIHFNKLNSPTFIHFRSTRIQWGWKQSKNDSNKTAHTEC